MKRFFACLILICCAVTIFAQNVKPYVVDLNKMPAVNDDKTVTFDKKTGTISLTGENAGIGL